MTLTFDLESGVRVMCDVATSVPILVFLGLSVLDFGTMYASDRRQTVTGLFAPKTIRSRERKFQMWNFRSLELSFLGTFAPWNFRALERERNKAKRKFQLWNCRIACIYTFKILSLFSLVQPIRAENRNLVGAVLL